MEPRDGELESDPVLPEEVGWLQLDGVPGRWGRESVRAGHGTAHGA